MLVESFHLLVVQNEAASSGRTVNQLHFVYLIPKKWHKIER